MKHRIINWFICQWQKYAGVEPDYTLELLIHSSRIRNIVYKCHNRGQIECIERMIENMGNRYGLTQSAQYMAELQDFTLLHKAELIGDGTIEVIPDTITEHEYNEDEHD